MLNKILLIGNLGRDPEIKTTQDGREIARFSIATSERWTDKSTGEKKEKTEWHNIVVLSDGLVNVVKNYLKKGSKVYVEGGIHTRKWQDDTGADRYTTEIVLKGFNATLIMLDSKGGSDKADYSDYDTQPGPQHDAVAEALDDEIPF